MLVQQAQIAPTFRHVSLAKPRILVVEDEAMIAMMIEDMLEDLDCEVAASFGDLTTTLNWLNLHGDDVDGALLDVNLAGETAFPIADLLYAKGVPFAFVTSYSAVPQARSYRATVLNKPVDLRALGSLVRSFGD